ncbi:LIM and senescent cell antigen-like-containing domain protein 2 [Clydaea vesicula]|uniref:LIM and senescent cell antigen-like-containing domain protein 2 n=1 Tax=Clydaea vesicula TaxID=447962 RepID=A0AAD5U8Q6_9FUNG|nr:LIM and senescent cell antigen-like-containing domain protein 2 [Clydaea vesicula]
MHWPMWTKGLRKMLGENATIDEKCIECEKKLVTADEIFVGDEKSGGHVYCESCYSSYFKKGNCHWCFKPVLGLGKEYVMQEKLLWHKECYKGKSCHECLETVFGEVLEALSRNYHPKCFKCFNCKAELSSSFLDFNDEPCCRTCFGKIKSQQDYTKKMVQLQQNSIPQNQETTNFVNGIKTIDINQISACSALCILCNEEIVSISGSNNRGLTLHNGEKYHLRCFNCDVCKKSIANGTYISDQGKFFHQECNQVITMTKFGGKKLNCNECKVPVTSAYIKHLDLLYHPSCFKCFACKTQIGTDGFMENKDGMPLCCRCKTTLEEKSKINEAAKPVYRAGLKPLDPKTKDDLSGSANCITTAIGGKSVCPLCNKTCYPAEQVPGPLATVWHRTCLRCKGVYHLFIIKINGLLSQIATSS